MIVKLEEDENGDLIIPFDEDLMSEIGWELGDTIQWTENDDGSFTLTRVVKNVLELNNEQEFDTETSHSILLGRTR